MKNTRSHSSSAYSALLGRSVVLNLAAEQSSRVLRGTVIGESDAALRVRIGEICEVDIHKEMILAVVAVQASVMSVNGAEATRIVRPGVPEAQVTVISENDPDAIVPNGEASGTDKAVDASLSGGDVSLESILCTEQLHCRPSRPADYKKENRALVALALALADSPRTILQTLADTILEVCQADSAGLSLLTTNDGGKRFYWPAIAGMWKPHIGGGTPRDFGPCGDVLDRNIPLLFRHFERRYTYFQPVTPPVEECLLVPFYIEGKAVGTIWAIAHDDRRKFDAEDERLMKSLGRFASSAYQVLASVDALREVGEALRQSEERFRNLAETLQAEVCVRTQELERRNTDVLQQSEQLRVLSHRLMQTQDQERRRIARELHDSAGQILTALGMNLARIIQGMKHDAPHLVKDAEESQLLVRQLNQEIRTTSYLLHPPLLDETGLPEALRWYIDGLRERSSLDISLGIPEDFGRLPREMELAMFRLVQECLTNVHRHSNNKSAVICIAREAESISLEVQDKGKGISPERLSEIQAQGSGVGITGMRERVRQFEGSMNIESNGGGTKILFRFPILKTAFQNERV